MAYDALTGVAILPATELTTTILPDRWLMSVGNTAFVNEMVPARGQQAISCTVEMTTRLA
jgi:hypothetical protein